MADNSSMLSSSHEFLGGGTQLPPTNLTQSARSVRLVSASSSVRTCGESHRRHNGQTVEGATAGLECMRGVNQEISSAVF